MCWAASVGSGPPLPVRSVGSHDDADYRPGEMIGEGGSGIVREAVQTALGRTVAMKTLKPGRPDARTRFLAEARVVGALDHPNVLPVYELAVDEDGEPFLVMKRVVGTPWSDSVQLDEPGGKPADPRRRGGRGRVRPLSRGDPSGHQAGKRAAGGLRGGVAERLGPRLNRGRAGPPPAPPRSGAGGAAGESCDGRLRGGVDATGVAGTPAYMAPEQARGDAVGPRPRDRRVPAGGGAVRDRHRPPPPRRRHPHRLPPQRRRQPPRPARRGTNPSRNPPATAMGTAARGWEQAGDAELLQHRPPGDGHRARPTARPACGFQGPAGGVRIALRKRPPDRPRPGTWPPRPPTPATTPPSVSPTAPCRKP